MSQMKGRKIPIMPQTVYPFWKVSIHTVKSRTIYNTKSELVSIHASGVMANPSFFEDHLLAFQCNSPLLVTGVNCLLKTPCTGYPVFSALSVSVVTHHL
jgi:hypothetical protein